MIEVEHPTLGVLEFPDGTDQATIVAAIKQAEQQYAQPQQQSGGVIDWLAENTPQVGMITGVASGMKSAAGAIGDVLQGNNPTENMLAAARNSPGGAALETALASGTGFLASMPAGIAGIGSTVMDGPEAGAGTVENVMSSAYAPRGETAQGMLQPIGRAVEAAQNLTGTGAEEIGRGLGIEPGTPAAAALYAFGSAVPEAVGMITGASLATKVRPKPTRAAAVGQTLDEQFGVSEPQAAIAEQPRQTITQAMPEQRQPVPRKEPKKQAEIRAAIEAGDKEGATYRVDQRGKIVKDKQAETVIRQGFSDGSVATIKKAPPADKGEMLKMLDVAERGLKNPIERARNRPSDVIGANVMKRWEAVRAANMKARKDINAAAEADLKGKVIDMTDEFDGFVDDMADLGVTIGEDGVSFKGSQIEGSDIGPIKRVVDRLTYQQDGMALHRLKQYIDSQIDWDNPTKQRPLDQKSVNALKRLRNGINEKLKAQSASYADANARASETFGVMGDMMDVMGRRFDPSAENAGVYAGQELRKVLSNYQKRADLIAAIDKLDEVSAKYGAKFNDDPINQVVFLNDLERVFGSFADNSLQGVMEKGAGRAINAATGRYGTADVAADIATSVVNRIYGVSEENAIRSMRELLRRDLVTKQ